MKKLFVFSDAHSYYKLLMKALEDAAFDINNKDHIIVSCGDLCDRGNGAKEILTFINNLPEERKICIIGNHELLMESLIAKKGIPTYIDVRNGTFQTALDITDRKNKIDDLKLSQNKYWNNYRKSWQFYFETDNYIFVHGWIPCNINNSFNMDVEYNENWRDATGDEFKNAIWLNGMNMWSKNIREKGKTIICGHYHTTWGHYNLHNEGIEYPEENKELYFKPFIDDGIIAIDGCTAYSGIVNIITLDITDEEFERGKWK